VGGVSRDEEADEEENEGDRTCRGGWIEEE
jgi:hypothetical protein